MPEIRDAQPGDAPAIATIQVVTWQAAYRGLMPDDVLAGLSVPARERWWTGILHDPPPRTSVLVATSGNAVVGFASVGPSLDADCDGETGTLYAIYLHPDRWRRGIGGRLHAAAMRRLADLGFGSATLWMLDGNERAAGFYRREGWAADGLRQLDTGPGGIPLDEIRLRRHLRGA